MQSFQSFWMEKKDDEINPLIICMCIEGASGSLFSNKKQPQKICFYLFVLNIQWINWVHSRLTLDYNFPEYLNCRYVICRQEPHVSQRFSFYTRLISEERGVQWTPLESLPLVCIQGKDRWLWWRWIAIKPVCSEG